MWIPNHSIESKQKRVCKTKFRECFYIRNSRFPQSTNEGKSYKVKLLGNRTITKQFNFDRKTSIGKVVEISVCLHAPRIPTPGKCELGHT